MTKILPVASEPETLIELAEAYGADCKNITFSQVYSLEPEELEFLPKPIFSMFFLFPIGDKDGPIEMRHKDDIDPNTYIKDKKDIPYFAHQIVGDLCGTMAMIHNIANNPEYMPIKEGSWMEKFMRETKDMTPAERGVYIKESEDLFELHNKNAADSTAPILEGKCDTHFAFFKIIGGLLWELDGRKPFPINHGKCDNIFTKVIDIIEKDFFANLSDDDKLRTSIIAISKI